MYPIMKGVKTGKEAEKMILDIIQTNTGSGTIVNLAREANGSLDALYRSRIQLFNKKGEDGNFVYKFTPALSNKHKGQKKKGEDKSSLRRVDTPPGNKSNSGGRGFDITPDRAPEVSFEGTRDFDKEAARSNDSKSVGEDFSTLCRQRASMGGGKSQKFGKKKKKKKNKINIK